MPNNLTNRSIPATAYSKVGRELTTKSTKQTQVTNLWPPLRQAAGAVRFFDLPNDGQVKISDSRYEYDFILINNPHGGGQPGVRIINGSF